MHLHNISCAAEAATAPPPAAQAHTADPSRQRAPRADARVPSVKDIARKTILPELTPVGLQSRPRSGAPAPALAAPYSTHTERDMTPAGRSPAQQVRVLLLNPACPTARLCISSLSPWIFRMWTTCAFGTRNSPVLVEVHPHAASHCHADAAAHWRLQASAAVSAAKRASPAPFWTQEDSATPQPPRPAAGARPESADRVYPWSWST